jgi:streptogramin lyase
MLKEILRRQGMHKPKKCLMIIMTLLLGLVVVPFNSKVSADTLGAFTSYSIPTTSSEPWSLATGLDGNLWFTESNKDKIGKSTVSGSVTEYALPSGYTEPRAITNGPQGALWFTADSATTAQAIGKITTSGTITMYDLADTPDHPTLNLGDEYIRPSSITSGGGYLFVDRGASRYFQKIAVNGTSTSIEVDSPDGYDGLGNDAWDLRGYGAQTVVFDHYNGDGVWVLVLKANTHSTYSPAEASLEKIYFDGTTSKVIVPVSLASTGWDEMIMGSNGDLWIAGGGAVKRITQTGAYTSVTLPTSGDTAKELALGPDGAIWGTVWRTPAQGSGRKIFRIDPTNNQLVEWNVASGSRPFGITSGPDDNVWYVEHFGNKVAKIGAGTISSTDSDGDGVTQIQELQQGTSDFLDDTDTDGLSDLTESQWFVDRDDVFCNLVVTYCEYPDPLQKDLYVEVDWMDDGTTNMQPTSSHVAAVEIALAAKGVRPHFDNGSLGGGNQVPYFSNVNFLPDANDDQDFYDFKNGNGLISAQFDSLKRYGIWRYVLVVPEINGSSAIQGIAYAGDDDSMLAYETLQTNHGLSFDDAFANTMLHELGHNLCLSGSTSYSGQDATCVFEGIDDTYSSDYESSMNYAFQYLKNLSDGSNGVDDHDDWSAVAVGFDDFTSQEVGDTVAHSVVSGKRVKQDPGKVLKDHRNSRLKKLDKEAYRKPIIN